MSRLDTLLQELCPDGVEYKKLKDVGTNFFRGSGIRRDEVTQDGIPCVRYGEIYTEYGISFEECKSHTIIDNISSPKWFGFGAILFAITGESVADIAKCTAYLGHEKCLAGGDIVVMEHNENPKYISYVLSTTDAVIQKGAGKIKSKVVHSSVPAIMDLEIPVPPLEIQGEIVRILDTFMELIAELKEEYFQRVGQANAVRGLMLTDAKKDSEICLLSDICFVEKGKTPIQKAVPGEYPMVVTTSERKSSSSYQFDVSAVCIPLVSSRGHGVASLNHVYYQEGKFALGNILCALSSKDESRVSIKYLYYYFEENKDYVLVPLMKGGANVALHMEDIERVRVPIPCIEKQEEIIEKLDKILMYVESLIPAEIEARTKQYEFYRDKLLTFKRKETA